MSSMLTVIQSFIASFERQGHAWNRVATKLQNHGFLPKITPLRFQNANRRDQAKSERPN